METARLEGPHSALDGLLVVRLVNSESHKRAALAMSGLDEVTDKGGADALPSFALTNRKRVDPALRSRVLEYSEALGIPRVEPPLDNSVHRAVHIRRNKERERRWVSLPPQFERLIWLVSDL